MENTEVKRLLYQDSEAFKAGIKVGRKEIVDKACEWLENIDYDMQYWNSECGFCTEHFISDFRKAMEEYYGN